MNGFGLAYVALAAKDVPAAARVLGELLGLPRRDLDVSCMIDMGWRSPP